MKFLCLKCDEVMSLAERQLPGDGTLTAIFACGECGHETAMLTNPMETQLVTSLGVEVGGRTVPTQPLQQTRTNLETPREEAPPEAPSEASAAMEGVGSGPSEPAGGPSEVTWSPEATDRLGRVPSFVRAMIKRTYADYARKQDIAVVTPEVMDKAREDLGLEGM